MNDSVEVRLHVQCCVDDRALKHAFTVARNQTWCTLGPELGKYRNLVFYLDHKSTLCCLWSIYTCIICKFWSFTLLNYQDCNHFTFCGHLETIMMSLLLYTVTVVTPISAILEFENQTFFIPCHLAEMHTR